ncbi:ribonuclease H-like domain-containing protein [Entophlyctis helioformis]|nr:ribonuclease H-like domain-containing protein [Entophlyctis helioformis]
MLAIWLRSAPRLPAPVRNCFSPTLPFSVSRIERLPLLAQHRAASTTHRPLRAMSTTPTTNAAADAAAEAAAPAANGKTAISGPLVWIDLEMTGLDLDKDTIIEIACIVTDGDLKAVDDGIHLIIHQPKSVVDNMNEWCIEHHGASGLTAQVLASTTTLASAETQVLDYVRSHVPAVRSGVLAGSSVHVDRQFLCKSMPALVDHLHYRIVDVSSVKEMALRWYGRDALMRVLPKKRMTHRALDDIHESISELAWYRAHLFRESIAP